MMGFYTALLILSPSKHPQTPEDCVVWRVSELLNIGYSVRDLPQLSHVQISHVSDRGQPHARAGVVTFSWIYPHLVRRLGTARKGCVFAPPFLVTEEDMRRRNVVFARTESQMLEMKPGSDCILPFYALHDFFPGIWSMQRHNKALASMTSEKDERAKHSIIMCEPCIWVPCRVVAGWLHDLLSAGSSREQLRFDREARARVEGWYGQLQAYAKIHARVLFVFDPVTWP